MNTLNNILTAIGCVILAGFVLGVMWLVWLIVQATKAQREFMDTYFSDIQAHDERGRQEALEHSRKGAEDNDVD